MPIDTPGQKSGATSAQSTWNQEQKKHTDQGAPDPTPVETAATSSEQDPAAEEGGEEPTVEDALLFIANHCEEIHEKVETLVNQAAEAEAVGARREKIIDKLHEENQRLRSGEIREAVEPVLRDLIRLHDDLEKSAKAWAAKPGGESAAVEFGIFADVAADALSRYGVEKFTAEPGSLFQLQEHRALTPIPTESRELDRRIHQVVRTGFRSGTRVLRSLEVEVYRYAQPKADAAQSK